MNRYLGVLALIGLICMVGCDDDSDSSDGDDSGGDSVATTAYPGTGIATADYIELGRISAISRFRSGVGHDYSDVFESCRSMKHYYFPREYPVRIFSPVDGVVDYVRDGGRGMQIGIGSGDRVFVLFHVALSIPLAAGDSVTAGQELGTHIGSDTYSDIAVREDDRYLSFFEVMDDTVFAAYQARGVASRTAMIITRAERDADPLSCSGETFASTGSIENWVDLL